MLLLAAVPADGAHGTGAAHCGERPSELHDLHPLPMHRRMRTYMFFFSLSLNPFFLQQISMMWRGWMAANPDDGGRRCSQLSSDSSIMAPTQAYGDGGTATSDLDVACCTYRPSSMG